MPLWGYGPLKKRLLKTFYICRKLYEMQIERINSMKPRAQEKFPASLTPNERVGVGNISGCACVFVYVYDDREKERCMQRVSLRSEAWK